MKFVNIVCFGIRAPGGGGGMGRLGQGYHLYECW